MKQRHPLTPRALARPVLLAAALAAGLPALAQDMGSSSTTTTTTTSSSGAGSGGMGSWWMPGSGRTAFGLNVGRSNYNAPCVAGFSCDDTGNYYSLYARNMMNDMWGTELAFVHMGTMERGGGDTRAYGLNFSAVGKVPMSGPLGIYGKIGALYGRTRTGGTTTVPGFATGNKNGFGLSVGAGVSWDFSPKLSAVLEVDRYDFRFAGTGREGVYATSVGLQYRY